MLSTEYEIYPAHKLINVKMPSQGCHGQGKVLENEKFSRSGKSQGITFSVREI